MSNTEYINYKLVKLATAPYDCTEHISTVLAQSWWAWQVHLQVGSIHSS